MGSRGVILATGIAKSLAFRKKHYHQRASFRPNHITTYCCTSSSLQPPHVPSLAQTARISLSSHDVEEFAPKIRQVVDWFGQLQAVDLESIEPSIRADTEDDNLRDDVPQSFENREATISAVPKYEEPYIRVPQSIEHGIRFQMEPNRCRDHQVYGGIRVDLGSKPSTQLGQGKQSSEG